MQTHPRILRAHVENRSHNRPLLSEKQRDRQERIIAATQTLMASFPGNFLTTATLALVLRTTPATIRRYFIDIDSILAEILVRHLVEVFAAISKIPRDHPNRPAAQRAAYIEATRTGWGALTEPHQLLIEKRHTLPDDLAKPIEDMRRIIGEALAGDQADVAFTLLDAPHLGPEHIEPMLAASPPAPAANQAAPAANQAVPAANQAVPAANQAVPAAALPEPPQPAGQAAYKSRYRDWRAAKRQKSLQAQAARVAALKNSA